MTRVGSSYGEHHGRAFGGWLIVFALGYTLMQHSGTVFSGLGDVGTTQTRWADWIDLLTPYVVTGAAAGALRGAGARRGTWTLFWLGTVLYTQGHGIHLAANSIGNASAPHAQPAYLWDEHVGHYLWYVGFYLVLVAMAVALADRRPRGGAAGHLLALLVGFTNFTNAVEGQTALLGIGAAVVFAVWGLFTRDGVGRLLLTAYGFSLLLFAVFGVWQGGFPQFSELGWI